MTYIPRRTVVFVPEKSISNPMEDMVSVPNVPFLVSIINFQLILYYQYNKSMR